MQLISRKTLLKVPLAVIGILVVCVGASVVLTDPAPSTLPRRTVKLLAGVAALLSGPPKPMPSLPLVVVPVVAATAGGLEVRDGDYVVGVELHGEARAYPLNVLSRPDHHVLNDTLGGRPIAVTWCGLCQSPLVYSRQVDGKALTFVVTGELCGENMIIEDLETGSDWPQMLGEAINGPLKGKTLEPIPSVWTDWKTWLTDQPKTTLPNIKPTVDLYRHDADRTDSSTEVRYFSNMQWGLVRGDESLSWPLKDIARQVVVNDSLAGLPLVIVFERKSATITAFERRIGASELTFRPDAEGLIDDQTNSHWDRITGRALSGALAGQRLTPVSGIVSHKRAWRALHPHTALRGGDAK